MTHLRRLLCGSLLVTGVSGVSYLWYCDITTRPLIDLVHDPASGATYEWSPGGDRVLERQSSLHSGEDEEAVHRRDSEANSSLRSNVFAQDGVDTSKLIRFSARECWCANKDPLVYNISLYYCMTPYTHCGIPSSGINMTTPPGCVSRNKTEFEKGVWPVIVVWFSLLLVWLCCTKSGHQVYDYVIAFFSPGWNAYVTDRIMRNDPDRANGLIRNYWRRRRMDAIEARYLQMIAELRDAHHAGDGQEVTTVPNELVLKTRIFKKSVEALAVKVEDLEDDDCDGNDDAACTICFGPLRDGDRVGALACDHIFHVECLKLWLVRRNTCPLCQMQDVATPRYTPREQDETVVAPADVAAGQEIEEQPNVQDGTNEPLAPVTHETPLQVWQNGLQQAIRSNRRRRGHG